MYDLLYLFCVCVCGENTLNLFLIVICLGRCACAVASKGNQRAACGNPFSPFTAWVLRPDAGLQVGSQHLYLLSHLSGPETIII